MIKYIKENGKVIMITDDVKIEISEQYKENCKNINKMGDTI